MYYLGIDWGLNKTGLAIADNELRIATVLGDVKTVNLIRKIKELQKEYDFNTVIFGSLKFNKQFGKDTEVLQDKKKTCLNKMKKIGINIEIAEEMFSTKIAKQNLLEGGKKNISKQDDGEAAKIILQGWLDFENSIELGSK